MMLTLYEPNTQVLISGISKYESKRFLVDKCLVPIANQSTNKDHTLSMRLAQAQTHVLSRKNSSLTFVRSQVLHVF